MVSQLLLKEIHTQLSFGSGKMRISKMPIVQVIIITLIVTVYVLIMIFHNTLGMTALLMMGVVLI